MVRRRRKAQASPPRPAEPPALPDHAQKVTLQVDGRARRWRGRVEAIEGARLRIRLLGSAPPIVPDPGTGVVVGWPELTGYRLGESTLVTAHGGDEVVVWTVAVARSRRVQRRGAFRVMIARPLTLTIEGREIETTTVDVSEGGLGCELDLAHAPDEGARLGVRLTVEVEDVERLLVGQVEVMRSVQAQDPARRALGLAWADEDAERAELLRRFVFAAQQAGRASTG